MRPALFFILFLSGSLVHALSWQDLWSTDDQQAQVLMKKGQYKKAQERFQQPDWQATAAYRAGNYEQAAKNFGALKTQQGYYNQGNALAHMGQYEEAIKAYDEALRINPDDKDALYNRQIVAELLKKDQEKQQNQQANNQQNQQNQDQKENNQQQGNNQQEQQENAQQKQQQAAKNQEKKQQNKAQQEKNKRANQNPEQGQVQNQQSAENREKQQAKEQWLNLIPDDPGGLMREKFLRDHLKRKRGWYQ